MNDFTGRRSTGRAKRIGAGLLEGLAAVGTAMADGPKLTRIEQIDAQITELRQERDHLIKELLEPGDLKVSDDYDPYWRRSTSTPVGDGHARLVECEGRSTSSRFHDAHPGCPYVEQIHNAHEFTLRD